METITSPFVPNGYCQWCSNDGQYIYHNGICPKIEEIEYHKSGNIKKVKFKENPTQAFLNIGNQQTSTAINFL